MHRHRSGLGGPGPWCGKEAFNSTTMLSMRRFLREPDKKEVDFGTFCLKGEALFNRAKQSRSGWWAAFSFSQLPQAAISVTLMHASLGLFGGADYTLHLQSASATDLSTFQSPSVSTRPIFRGSCAVFAFHGSPIGAMAHPPSHPCRQPCWQIDLHLGYTESCV